ncbi:gas vesicle accessory protein GvpU [Endozoicomonas arenosclerae]|uniref:gas vesicle accessory protein GvpU n=1 Tax=Endozoicomonas arenosclerae TaxID=1633495 RepID=UPI000782763B|nr:gas vesicle accessory protein GvpU [Endozoicomonas arenosclerae]
MSEVSEDTVTEKNYNNDTTDWFLQSLVISVIQADFTIPITLNVGGQLVSGELICGSKYFHGFADEFTSGWTDQKSAEHTRAHFTRPAEEYVKEKFEKNPDCVQFIHLKNTRFFNTNGQPIPGNRGVWWRGQLSKVDGFMLGTLSAD